MYHSHILLILSIERRHIRHEERDQAERWDVVVWERVARDLAVEVGCVVCEWVSEYVGKSRCEGCRIVGKTAYIRSLSSGSFGSFARCTSHSVGGVESSLHNTASTLTNCISSNPSNVYFPGSV